MQKESTWPVFYSQELGFFTCQFEDGMVYGPGSEEKYANDTGYVLHAVFDNELDAQNRMLDLSEANAGV